MQTLLKSVYEKAETIFSLQVSNNYLPPNTNILKEKKMWYSIVPAHPAIVILHIDRILNEGRLFVEITVCFTVRSLIFESGYFIFNRYN